MDLLLITCVLASITYVDSQTPLLTPTILSVNKGETATFNCDVGVKNNHVTWFARQSPGEVPQLLLYHHHTYTEPRYGPGMSSAHYGCTINSAGTQYQLIIKNTDTSDTVLVYCYKWYDNVGWVFSQSSKLIVTVDKFPEPAINVFAPYVEDHSTKDNQVITCHVRKMSVSLVNVKWIKDGTTIQDGVSTSQPTRDTDNTFSLSSYLTIPASDLNKDSIYSCWVQQEGSSSFTSQGINLSQC
ncbi:immunoglobulin lambda-1 light chain-like isoform X12 [Pelobates fuscus]|uniref:immunoglobulin lambda-1 light chain-like isoform X12 n=1 Tax=Pelobates fuscus TaxID=191477 RepID=UPI002FE483D7